MTAEVHNLLVKVQIHHLGSGVRGIVEHQGHGLGHGILYRPLQPLKKVGRGRGGQIAQARACNNKAERMDRVRRIRHQHNIARRGNGHRQIGQSLFRTYGRNHLAFRVKLDAEAPRIVPGKGFA